MSQPKYNDGFLNTVGGTMGEAVGYPEKWARSVGFNNDIHPISVERKYTAAERTAVPWVWETFAQGSRLSGQWLFESDLVKKGTEKLGVVEHTGIFLLHPVGNCVAHTVILPFVGNVFEASVDGRMSWPQI